ncbi:MAG TPA: hypothetical protein PKZ58_08580, partial [Bacillota bacterium]|nr:hypothetical protein [Bacillota bacterium]
NDTIKNDSEFYHRNIWVFYHNSTKTCVSLVEIEPHKFEYKTANSYSTVSVHFPHNYNGMTIQQRASFFTGSTIETTISEGWTLDEQLICRCV